MTILKNIAYWQNEQFNTSPKYIPGLLVHAQNEVDEIKEAPEDAEEWADLLFIALHGLHSAISAKYPNMSLNERHYEAVATLYLKLNKNFNRKWPAPVEGKPTEHIDE